VLITALGLFFETSAMACDSVLQAHEKVQYQTYGQLVSAIIYFVLAFWWLDAGHGLMGVIWANVASRFARLAVMAPLMFWHTGPWRRALPGETRPGLRTMLKLGFALCMATTFGIISYKVDTVMLEAMLGAAATGIYVLGHRALDVMLIVPNLFATALFPALARYAARSQVDARRLSERALRYMVSLMLPATWLVALSAQPVIEWFARGTESADPGQFADSILVLQLVIWGVPFQSANHVLNRMLIAAGRERVFFGIGLAALVTNVTLNLLLIPRHGYYGAAVSDGDLPGPELRPAPVVPAPHRCLDAPAAGPAEARPGARGELAGHGPAAGRLAPAWLDGWFALAVTGGWTPFVGGAVLWAVCYGGAVIAWRVLDRDDLQLLGQLWRRGGGTFSGLSAAGISGKRRVRTRPAAGPGGPPATEGHRMEIIRHFAASLSGTVWGWPEVFPVMVAALLLTGLFTTVSLRFLQLRKLKHSLDVIRGKYDDPAHEGDLSHFQALTTALSATVGIGNIAGVATAIHYGGPGALFWMWVTAVFGMALKYAECTLSMKHRSILADGKVAGGPMYYIEKGLGKRWKPLAVIFAVCAVISSFGSGNSIQAFTVADQLRADLGVPTWLTGVVSASLIAAVILGGIQRIGLVTSRLVPFMAVVYVAGALLVLVMNLPAIPGMLMLVFSSAFQPAAQIGGFAGGTFIFMLTWGVKRGLFSNESGQGSAPIAHAAARTDEPVREGLVAMMEPMIDTLIICTLTGLVILSTGVWNDKQPGELPINPQTDLVVIAGEAQVRINGRVDGPTASPATCWSIRACCRGRRWSTTIPWWSSRASCWTGAPGRG
jgi:amino acid carrier protein